MAQARSPWVEKRGAAAGKSCDPEGAITRFTGQPPPMVYKLDVHPPPVNRRPPWPSWRVAQELLELLRRLVELLLLARKLVPA